MIINHVTHSTEKLASFRYFCLSQKPYLEKMGHEVSITKEPRADADIVIFNKHMNPLEPQYAWHCKHVGIKTIFHVTDNHFVTQNRLYYEIMCGSVDAVTCTVPELKAVIHRFTGKDAIVMPDPYYYDEQKIKYQPEEKLKLCWFGHAVNTDSLRAIWNDLKDYEIEVVTDGFMQDRLPFKITPWSREAMLNGISKCDVVIIPSIQDEKRKVKSPNRMVDSIRRGRFVISDPLPCYEEFTKMMYTKGVLEGLEWIKTQHPNEIRRRIKKAQNHIREKFSPSVIAKKWDALYKSMVKEKVCR